MTAYDRLNAQPQTPSKPPLVNDPAMVAARNPHERGPSAGQDPSRGPLLQERRQNAVSPVHIVNPENPTIVAEQTTPSSADLRLLTDLRRTNSQLAKELEFGNYSNKMYQDYSHRTPGGNENGPVRTSSVKSLGASLRSLSPGSAASSPGVGPLADITPLPSPIGSQSGSWMDMPSAAMHISVSQSPPHASFVSPAVGQPSTSPPEARKHYRADQAHLEQARSSLDIVVPRPRSYSNRSASDHVPIANPRVKNIILPHLHSPPDVGSPLTREEYVAAQRGITSPDPPSPPKSSASVTEGSESQGKSLHARKQSKSVPLQYEAQTLKTHRTKKWVGIRQLGVGTFSTVMLATSELGAIGRAEETLNPQTLVAVKICESGPAGGADEKKIQSSLRRELEILKMIHHPSLVHLRAVNIQEKRAFLVLDYSAGGDLFELASLKLNVLTPSFIRRIFAELVDAVSYLHEHYIVHRDIKLENVLVNPRVSSLSSFDYATHAYPIITLTDLGLGRVIPQPPESPMLSTRCGSEDYAAPELLIGQEYDGRQTDIWALGVLLYAVMEGRLPFDPIPGARRQSPTTHRIARCEWQWVRWGDRDGDWDAGVWSADHKRGGAGANAASGSYGSPASRSVPQPTDRDEFLRWGQELEAPRQVVEGLLKRVNRRWTLAKVRAQPWVSEAINVPGGLTKHAWEED